MFKIAWHRDYAHALPPGHRFPMEKYELLPEQLLHEGSVEHANFFEPGLAQTSDILLTHDATYWEKLATQSLSKSEIRRTGFPLSPQLITRETRIMQGTIDCAKYALNFGVSMNIAGGTHHAYSNLGEGFCLLNDNAMAANFLLKNGFSKRIFIVDLDVHQGNGTAEIFKDNPNVFTFSMHGKNNFPLRKEQSDRDVPLEDGITDEAYLALLDREFKRHADAFEPDFMFYQCGVDVLESDKLGRLGMSIQGCKERDRIVLQYCKDNDIPLCCSMGGGYSEKIALIIEAHANTYRLAQEIFF